MAAFTYDGQGRRISITRGASPAATSYSYNATSQLGNLAHNLDGAGTANDVTQSFGYSPAGQITTRTLSNDSFAFSGYRNTNRGYATNGLNQYTGANTTNTSATFAYGGNGNLSSSATSEGGVKSSVTYSYDAENRFVAASGAKTASLLYDPLGRLIRTHDGNTANARWFVYDGDNLVAEYDGSGAMLKRYLHGPGVDEPLAWFDGPTTDAANRHDLFANAQGSVVAVTGLGVTRWYDALGRRTREGDSTGDATRPGGWDRGSRYSYFDARGNRTVLLLNGYVFIYTYDGLDRVTRIAAHIQRKPATGSPSMVGTAGVKGLSPLPPEALFFRPIVLGTAPSTGADRSRPTRDRGIRMAGLRRDGCRNEFSMTRP